MKKQKSPYKTVIDRTRKTSTGNTETQMRREYKNTGKIAKRKHSSGLNAPSQKIP
jgi:hypothetical protein